MVQLVDLLAKHSSLVLATGCALVMYLLVPTAPPRLSGTPYIDVLVQTSQYGWWGADVSVPGGWGEGLRELGHRARGIDSDLVSCATARAAGHERLEADVSALDPRDFSDAVGLIASPPCQAYSSAGKGLGKKDKPRVLACARELGAGRDTRARHRAGCKDPRSLLTVEPLRWAIAIRPRWLAMEQVPAVAEMWAAFAELLGAHGYHCAVGLLSADTMRRQGTMARAA